MRLGPRPRGPPGGPRATTARRRGAGPGTADQPEHHPGDLQHRTARPRHGLPPHRRPHPHRTTGPCGTALVLHRRQLRLRPGLAALTPASGPREHEHQPDGQLSAVRTNPLAVRQRPTTGGPHSVGHRTPDRAVADHRAGTRRPDRQPPVPGVPQDPRGPGRTAARDPVGERDLPRHGRRRRLLDRPRDPGPARALRGGTLRRHRARRPRTRRPRRRRPAGRRRGRWPPGDLAAARRPVRGGLRPGPRPDRTALPLQRHPQRRPLPGQRLGHRRHQLPDRRPGHRLPPGDRLPDPAADRVHHPGPPGPSARDLRRRRARRGRAGHRRRRRTPAVAP